MPASGICQFPIFQHSHLLPLRLFNLPDSPFRILSLAVYYPRNERLFSIVLSYPINSTLTWFSSVFALSISILLIIQHHLGKIIRSCRNGKSIFGLGFHCWIFSNVSRQCSIGNSFHHFSHTCSDLIRLDAKRNFALGCVPALPCLRKSHNPSCSVHHDFRFPYLGSKFYNPHFL